MGRDSPEAERTRSRSPSRVTSESSEEGNRTLTPSERLPPGAGRVARMVDDREGLHKNEREMLHDSVPLAMRRTSEASHSRRIEPYSRPSSEASLETPTSHSWLSEGLDQDAPVRGSGSYEEAEDLTLYFDQEETDERLLHEIRAQG